METNCIEYRWYYKIKKTLPLLFLNALHHTCRDVNSMSSSTTAFSSCRLSAMPHRTGSKRISILLGKVYPNCREYRRSNSFYQQTHKCRQLLPNPASSGRCIEDFYPLVYFLGLCKGLSYLLYKNMSGKHPSKKHTSLPLRKEGRSKITLFAIIYMIMDK